ncbi:AHH domain-containing protein [Clostridium kluyveri]|uniref:AHH domain-containing protein n=1 Tax=Clostridium kluyveri TaxID=1534 RepID=UPI002245F438|nr:AHH domain-containing protein [Clostridium kluyveri]UZQ52153.1 AHH domain-containing protein [Clostridium kluyveri]
MKTIGNIKTPGNKAENMTQYIRSVLYGQHQFALPNGMGTINASEDLFKFSKIEDNVSNEAKKIIEGAAEARLIPGQEGIVTGGNSTKLGKNMLESMGLKHSSKWSGYQAQHVIPAEMGDNAVIQKIGMNLDDASNGIFLRTPDESISTMSRHQGYHSVYNEMVERQLSKLK